MSSTPVPTVICVTPVKNEARILPRFLRCAATWADHILIADQIQATRAVRCNPVAADVVDVSGDDGPPRDLHAPGGERHERAARIDTRILKAAVLEFRVDQSATQREATGNADLWQATYATIRP